MNDYRILPLGDAAFAVEFGDRIDRGLNERVLALSDAVGRARLPGVVETIPTFRSLTIAFDPSNVGYETLVERVAMLMAEGVPTPKGGREWVVPACYHPEVAPDIEDAAARLGFDVPELASRHASIAHHVYMLGFLPGQPYLGELPDSLVLSRRMTPRPRVEAGVIGVAMRMTCIMPRVTPCGLNILARTPMPLWSPLRPDGALFEPGDTLLFEPISLDRFHQLQREEEARAPSPVGGAV